LDGFRVYQSAVSKDEIDDNIQKTLIPVKFHINNIPFESLGINVETTKGLLSLPDRKDPLKVNWEDYHGEVIDLVKPVYEARNIELGCWIKANSQDELVTKWMAVRSIFESAGLQRLHIGVGTRPLVFDVYHPEKLEGENHWRSSGPYFRRFTLKLKEPLPVKRVLRVVGDSCTITLTSNKIVRISWGDGQATDNVYGIGQTVSHTYTESGTYYVLVQGNVEEITDFSTDATVIFNRL